MMDKKVKATLFKVLGVAYVLQLLIVMPMFLGAIYRHEWPMWVWQVSLDRFELGAILIGGYSYLLFYSGLFVVPFILIMLWFLCTTRYPESSTARLPTRNTMLMLSAWIGATLFLFPDSVSEFIRHLPWGGPSEWLIIGWIVSGLFVMYAFRRDAQQDPNKNP